MLKSKIAHPKTAVAAALLTAVLMGAAPAAAGTAFAENFKQFQSVYKKVLTETGTVGSSFWFVHDNRVLAKEYYGFANLEQNRKVDENTIYHWASITKTFCGIAIMQLRDRGLLKLDDPAVEYLPELNAIHNPFGKMSDITLRHLLTHSGGFRGATWPWKDKPWHPHEPACWEQLVAMFPYTQVHFEPGSQSRYSNLGIIFLGRIIEQLTTDDWEVYIDKNIFKPLGMHRSYFDTTPYHLMKDKCQSYIYENDERRPAHPDINTGITVSNGGLKAPFPDFRKYIDFLLGNPDDPEMQAVYDGVLKRASLEEMWVPQIEYGPARKDDRGRTVKAAQGLIFFLEEIDGMRIVWHSGGQNAFATYFLVQPESRSAYIAGFNTQVIPVENGRIKSTRIATSAVKDFVVSRFFPLFR